jgi:uncharacterized protein YceK
MNRAFLLFVVAALLSGCATLQPHDFAGSKTHFDLIRYFTGHARSWGVFENDGGAPKKWFVADSVGRLTPDGTLVLTQHFRFSDGKTQERTWRVWRVDATHWDATRMARARATRFTGSTTSRSTGRIRSRPSMSASGSTSRKTPTRS